MAIKEATNVDLDIIVKEEKGSRIILFFMPTILEFLGKILPTKGSSHLRDWHPQKIESIW